MDWRRSLSKGFSHAPCADHNGSALCALRFAVQRRRAAEQAAIDPDAYYAITYEVSAFEVQTIRPEKIIEVTTIGSVPFLIIDVGGPQKALGDRA